MYAPDENSYQIGVSELESLFLHLANSGFNNLGPIYRDGAIMLDHLSSFDDFTSGLSESIGKGQYQIHENAHQSLFQYTVGPQSFKKFLHPERRQLWSANKSENGFEIESDSSSEKMAFWGVKSCDLAAITILDQVFLQDDTSSAYYQSMRENTFVIAVGCTHPSTNCFCTTQDTGPSPSGDFDFSLVEIEDGSELTYLVEAGSERARCIAENLSFSVASSKNIAKGVEMISDAAEKIKVRFDRKEVAEKLKENIDHKRWDEIAKRCLSCANCTMVCPTCFCTSTEDIIDITGDHTERWLSWDSCFNGDFSYIHGGKIRSGTKSRYRQWLTHKLSNWYDQFGSSGCVGCGRCTTWCPVGIDLTEEVHELTQ